MADAQEQDETPTPIQRKKACQIQLMFPAEDDLKALQIKKAIDAIVDPIADKRYTFTITEVS